MEESAAPTVTVTDGAAVADGGSLWIRISVDGEARDYSLDRALASRGTPRYDSIHGAHGVLSEGERRELRVLLERIADPAIWAGIVGTFIQVLKRPDESW
ncbi:hypothetical protein [Burkholderia cenocepacia]|uniref:hypothetical protein n=1 Tax=Burkholderia cenocepacia TaxID=95486 RepID=UPI002AAF6D6E|nr:hypothetical protein [Burkholderia cenocepacia]